MSLHPNLHYALTAVLCGLGARERGICVTLGKVFEEGEELEVQ